MTVRPPFRLRRAQRGRPSSRVASIIAALAALILLVQLFAAAAHHDHELAAKSQHCVTCALHAHPDAAPPQAPPPVSPAIWTLAGVLAPSGTAGVPLSPPEHLLPPAQAPPFLSLR